MESPEHTFLVVSTDPKSCTKGSRRGHLPEIEDESANETIQGKQWHRSSGAFAILAILPPCCLAPCSAAAVSPTVTHVILMG